MGLHVLGAIVALCLAGCTAQKFQVNDPVLTYNHYMYTNRIYQLFESNGKVYHATVDASNQVVLTSTDDETTQTLQLQLCEEPTSMFVADDYKWVCTKSGNIEFFDADGQNPKTPEGINGRWCFW